MAEYGELYLPPVLEAPKAARKRQNPNKGRKWDEWMPKRAQKKIRRALALAAERRRGTHRLYQSGGRKKRKVIAVLDDGQWTCFESQASAARAIGTTPSVVSCICYRNKRGSETREPQRHPNHDYRCHGVRLYYENDRHWMERIRQ